MGLDVVDGVGDGKVEQLKVIVGKAKVPKKEIGKKSFFLVSLFFYFYLFKALFLLRKI